MGELSYMVGGDSNLVSFRSAARVPITSLKCNFTPIQEGSGDPSPENIRSISGWQGVEVYQDSVYLPKEYQRINYLESTGTQYFWTDIIVQDGLTVESVSTYATNQDSYLFGGAASEKNDRLCFNGIYSGNIQCAYPSGWFYAASGISQNNHTIYRIKTTLSNNQAIVYVNGNMTFNGIRSGTIPSETGVKCVCFGARASDGNAKYFFKGKLYELHVSNNNELIANFIPCRRKSDNKPGMYDTVSQTFFTNQGTGEFICGPDIGETVPITFYENLYITSTKTQNTTLNTSGEEISEVDMETTDYISVIEGSKYIIKYTSTYGARTRRIMGYDSSNNFVESLYSMSWATAGNTLSSTITIPTDINKVKICMYSEDNDISFHTEDPITVYGGYIDVAKGELVQTHDIAKFLKSEFNREYIASDTNKTFHSVITTELKISANIFEDGRPSPTLVQEQQLFNLGRAWPSDYNSDYDDGGYLGSPTTRHVIAIIPDSIYQVMSDTDYVIISYQLKDPITYKLSPIQLQTLLDQNNIWSNTNGNTEVSYAIHDSAMIRSSKKQIIGNEPHIETASGNIANFQTDMVAPLKEAKIYFNPIQEGSGDPSPENVREISGRNSLNIYNALKNLWGGKYATDEIITQYKTLFPNGNDIQYGEDNEGKYLSLGNGYHYDSINMSPSFKPKENTVYTIIITAKVSDASLASANLKIVYTDNDWDAISLSENKDCKVITTKSNKTVKGIYCRFLYKNTFIYYENMLGIFEGNITINEYEPYSGQAHTIDWTNDIGSVYGGYVDLIKGELVQEWSTLTFNGTENWSSQAPHDFAGHSYDTMFLSDAIPDMVFSQPYHGYTNWIPNSTGADKDINSILCGQFGWSDNRYYIFNATAHLENVTDIASLKIYLSNHPLTICYKLITPIVHQLTPTQLKTLKGTNNIWSNANGPIEVKYWTH